MKSHFDNLYFISLQIEGNAFQAVLAESFSQAVLAESFSQAVLAESFSQQRL